MTHNKSQDKGWLLYKRFNPSIGWYNFLREFWVRQKRIFHYLHLSSFAVKLGLVPLYNYLMDKFQGVDTYGYILQSEISSDTKIKYGPGGWRDLKMTLGSKVSADDVFIDFGSGKGRMVYLAARYYPFKKVIGVEIFDNLNNIARKNIERNRHRLHCKDVELVTTNVSNYSIPEDLTVVYFYDPFRGAVFTDLINRLRISLNQHPREMRIIYRNPRMHEYIVENGFTVTLKLEELIMYSGH
jgi:hypothetical protein